VRQITSIDANNSSFAQNLRYAEEVDALPLVFCGAVDRVFLPGIQ
jgi:hypothetical protein